MTRNSLVALVMVIFIIFPAACSQSPSPSAIQTAIAETQTPRTAETTATPSEASTALPTPKPKVSCPDSEVKTYLSELDSLLEEFDDTVTIAKSTSRIGLASVVADMQSNKREIRRLVAPECASYLTDLVMVAVQAQIDAFLSFMAQDGDTAVARKLQAAEKARTAVNEQIEAFRKEPLDAYETTALDARKLAERTQKVEPFVRPDDWTNVSIPTSPSLILSIPKTWTSETFGDNGEFLQLKNDDGTLKVNVLRLSSDESASTDSDAARLFALQTTLETQNWDFYSEQSAESGVYALNRGYVVRFSNRRLSFDDISDNLWAEIVTPEQEAVVLMTDTTRDSFAQIDLLTLNEVYSSIRREE
jgi:hypothetical protein